MIGTIDYILAFGFSFVLGVLFTLVIRKLALKFKIVDYPQREPERKIHPFPIPLLGGLAIFLSFVLVTLYYTYFTDKVLGGYMLEKYVWGIIIGGFLLMLGGFLDDKYHLTPLKQVIWPILASLVIIGVGIGTPYLRNPFGDVIQLDTIRFTLFTLDGLPYKITLLADIFSFVWLMGMMYTTKFLDGLDGLVPGITVIGSFVIFILSLNKEVAQPETALLAIILGGVALGFLIFNFYPAKIFLGEGGSIFAGFMLGVLAIIAGSKVATALLIMGIPILDVLWVILRRAFKEKRSPFWADKKHLHFRLLDIGFSHRQAVLFLYLITIVFGASSLFLNTGGKLVALIILVIVMIILALSLVLIYRFKKSRGYLDRD